MTNLTNNPSRRTKPTGDQVESARYTIADGERILYSQRICGVVSSPPGQPVALEPPSTNGEDNRCRPRGSVEEEARANAPCAKRPNGDGEPPASADASASTRGHTGARVELARYTVSAGERVLYGQRVHGVVRVTDVPLRPDGRAYLVERGLEEEGASANAALHALIEDYLRQASILDEVPMVATLF